MAGLSSKEPQANSPPTPRSARSGWRSRRTLWLEVRCLSNMSRGVWGVRELPTATNEHAFRPLQTASLTTFRGEALTDLLAGLAANSIGSFVKGFTPLRASVAGLFTTDILTKPGMTNSPDSFNSL